MKRIFNRFFAFALTAAIFVSASAFVSAADNSVTYFGKERGFDFGDGSRYTTTDLFDNFKGVMPGDRLSDTIKVVNKAEDCDYINVYLRVEAHDETDNPPVVDSDETLATMQDFLKQLTMRIYNGNTLIYEASPDQSGALADNVLLGELAKGKSLDIKVELDVPIELDNRYASRVGEVDWVFTVEELYYPVNLTAKKVWVDKGTDRPGAVSVVLYNGDSYVERVSLSDLNGWEYTWYDLDGEGDWKVVEQDIPTGYKATYKTVNGITTITNTSSLIQTGQLNWPIPVLGVSGLLLLIVGSFILIMKKRDDRE